MDHKIVAVCLMNSRGIRRTLAQLASGSEIRGDRDMAVVAALKLLEPKYQGVSTAMIFKDLQLKSDDELSRLARTIHPVLCSLKLEKWLGVSGNCHYLAQSEVVTGGRMTRILLDGKASEIPQPEMSPSTLVDGAHRAWKPQGCR